MSTMKLALISSLALLGSCTPSPSDHALDLNGNVKRYENGTAVKRSDTYCAFYSDSVCSKQVGSAHYDVTNGGCFANSGRYAKCENADDQKFRMIQSPNNDANCDTCQTGCTRWKPGDFDVCWDLNNYVNPSWSTYRFVNNAEDCAPSTC